MVDDNTPETAAAAAEEPKPRVKRRGEFVIPVTRKHIDESMQKNSSHCMTAEAIKEALPTARFVSVDLQSIRWTDPAKGLRYVFLTPRVCQGEILAFDQGETVSPFTLRMRPAQIVKSGRTHKYQQPDAAQLKELGLKIPPQEDEIGGATGEQRDLNVHPQTVDLEPTPTPSAVNIGPQEAGNVHPGQRRRRVLSARQAGNGTISTVLGGKPPGVSVLARREFGLRQLRK